MNIWPKLVNRQGRIEPIFTQRPLLQRVQSPIRNDSKIELTTNKCISIHIICLNIKTFTTRKFKFREFLHLRSFKCDSLHKYLLNYKEPVMTYCKHCRTVTNIGLKKLVTNCLIRPSHFDELNIIQSPFNLLKKIVYIGLWFYQMDTEILQIIMIFCWHIVLRLVNLAYQGQFQTKKHLYD